MDRTQGMAPRGLIRRALMGLIMAAALLALALPARGDGEPPQVVEYVDLSRYVGLWYEIASNPTWFEFGCVGTTATYALRPDGLIDVQNRCYNFTFKGSERVANGLAAVVDPVTNAKLSVSFMGAPPTDGEGNYWILDLGRDYEYAAVGDPTRRYLWILSRTPSLDEDTYQGILARLEAQNYDTSRLKMTRQRP